MNLGSFRVMNRLPSVLVPVMGVYMMLIIMETLRIMRSKISKIMVEVHMLYHQLMHSISFQKNLEIVLGWLWLVDKKMVKIFHS